MTNPKIPTRIVDKNGKQTTVHRAVVTPSTGAKRSIPTPGSTQPLTPAMKKVQSSLKRSKLAHDPVHLFALVKALGKRNHDNPAVRYTGFVKDIQNIYGIDQYAAKNAADGIYKAINVTEGISDIVQRDVMRKAATKTLVANHKVRFPRNNENDRATENAQRDAVRLASDDPNTKLVSDEKAEVDSSNQAINFLQGLRDQNLSTVDVINVLFQNSEDGDLKNVNIVIHDSKFSASASPYQINASYQVLKSELSIEAQEKALALVWDDKDEYSAKNFASDLLKASQLEN